MCTYFISTYYSITEKKLYKHWSKQLHKLKALYFFPGYYWHVWSRFNCIYWEGNKRRLLSFKIDTHFIHSHILVGVHDSLQPSHFSCYTGIITGTTFICHSPNSAYDYNQIHGDMLKWYGFVCICATVIIFYDSVWISSLPPGSNTRTKISGRFGWFYASKRALQRITKYKVVSFHATSRQAIYLVNNSPEVILQLLKNLACNGFLPFVVISNNKTYYYLNSGMAWRQYFHAFAHINVFIRT